MYESFFGFQESPFRVTPDPRFLYHNPCYDEAIAALSYGIEQRKGFITLVGEVGTGKTTLLRHLLDTIAPNVRTVLLIYPTVSFTEILEQILVELGIPVEGARKAAMLQRLHEFLLEHTASGGNVALLFDEAQALESATLEELRLLSNLETGSEKIVQLVLAGQPEFEDKLRRPEHRQLRQRVALHVRLRPLTAEEVPAYITARLQHAGAPDLRLFEPSAMARIAAVTGGIPRVINVLCDACCTTALAAQQQRISLAIVDESWADFESLTPDGDELPGIPAEVRASVPSPASTPPPAAPSPPASTPPPSPPPSVPSPPTTTPPRPSAPPPTTTTAPPPPAPPGFAPPPRPAPPPPGPPRSPTPLTDRVFDERLLPPWPLLAGAMLVILVAAGLFAVRLSDDDPVGTHEPPPTAIAPTRPTMPSAPARTIPPPARPQVAAGQPSAIEALDTVDAFRSAYEREDLSQIASLFAIDARKGEIVGRDGIVADYQRFFANNENITYTQPSASIEPGSHHMIVKAPFEITYRDIAGRPISVRGLATWKIVRLGAATRIASLDFDLDRMNVP